ncbi:MAG: hypothetical protein HKN14_08825 [Marinicaulis sp.]|nr:hypothetical protein [Marinicaulis sp.]
MSRPSNFLNLIIAVMIVSVTIADDAFANETNKIRGHLNTALEAKATMQQALANIENFDFNKIYCIGADDEERESHRKSLGTLKAAGNTAYKNATSVKNTLTGFAGKGNGRVRKLNSLSNGAEAGTAIANKSFYRGLDTLNQKIENAYDDALSKIKEKTKYCDATEDKAADASSPAAPSSPGKSRPAPVSDDVADKAVEYLAEIELTGEYQEFDLPKQPDILCSEVEKNALSREFFRLEKLAIANHRIARKLRLSIFEKMDEYKIAQRATIEGSTEFQAFEVVLTKLGAAFDNAVQEVERRTQALDDVRAKQRKLWDTPVVDCSKKDDRADTEVGVIDRLKSARRAAPDYKGASESRFGFPDFGKIDRRRLATGGTGFDGSEAEKAVRDAAKKVDMSPRVYIVEEPAIFADPMTSRSAPARIVSPAIDTAPTKVASPLHELEPTPGMASASSSVLPSETRDARSFKSIDVSVDHSKEVTIAKPAPTPTTTTARSAPKTTPVTEKKPLVFNGTYAPHPGAPTSESGTMTAVETPPLVILDYLGNPVGTKITDDEKTKSSPPKGE